MLGQSMVDVKRVNRRSILQILHKEEGISRKRLAEKLNLTSAAITGIVSDLIDEGIVCVGGEIPGNKNVGRKEITIELSRDSYGLGITILNEEIIFSAINFAGTVIFEQCIPHPSNKYNPNDSLRFIARYLLDAIKKNNIPRDKVLGVGVGLRGIVNSITGVSESSLDLWNGAINVKEFLEELLPFHIDVDNNVRILASAQNYFEKNNSTENTLFIRSEYGIGGSIIIDHETYSGSSERAGEIGHVHIPGSNHPCRCGSLGCLESTASVYGMLALAKEKYGEQETPNLYRQTEANIDNITLSNFLSSAQEGDIALQKIIEKSISDFVYVVSATTVVIDVKRIILYGKIFENSYYTDMLFNAFKVDIMGKKIYDRISISDYNCKLETIATAVKAVNSFVKRGAIA